METIEQTRKRLEAFTKESFPDADIAPGTVLSELIIKLASTLHNPIKNAIAELSNGQFISDVIEGGVASYTELVDKIASNYGVKRNQGRKVTGIIKVTVAQKKTYFVQSGLTFLQPNLSFKFATKANLEVVPYDTTIGSNQTKLLQEGNFYYFLVSVEAVEDSEKNDTQLSSGTKFSLAPNSVLDAFMYGEAYGNFSSGQAKEPDIELITRFREGLNNKSVVSPSSLLSVLRYNFPTVKGISVVGANDTEMVRSKKNIFGISTLGMADVYVRTSDSIETQLVQVKGTRTATNTSTWKLVFDKNTTTLAEAKVNWPRGFYKIVAISPIGNFTGTYVVTSKQYGSESRAEYRNNVINDASEARVSVYQTAEVIFTVIDASPKPDLARDFLVTLSYSPEIENIQNFLISDENRVACADYLVKAVIPCDVTLKLNIHKRNSLDEVPVSNIKRDIFNYVNNIPVGEDLVASRIIDICHNYSIKRVDFDEPMVGNLFIPEVSKDASLTITGEDSLTIPHIPEKGITKQTTAFFINYLKADGQTDNIGIQLI